MKNIGILFALAGILFAAPVYAQQEAMYGQYVFNNSVINPAQAGIGDLNQWGVLARFQFLGIEGGPRTNSAFANLQLPRHLGLAVGIYQDRLGVEENLQFQADLAYHARLSERWTLSAGIRLLFSHYRANFRDLRDIEPGDPFFDTNVNSGLQLNSGAGLLLSSDRWFFGLGMPRIFNSEMTVYDPGNYGFRKENTRHLFAYAGRNIELSDQFMFTPSTLFKYSDDAPVQLDLNAVFSYNQVFDFGPLLRSNLAEGWVDAVGFLVGLRLAENWYFGYMFEYPTNDLNLVTRQTHEISLRYVWGSRKDYRIRSPRYFL